MGWRCFLSFFRLASGGLTSFITVSLFFFRHRKKKQERCHRSGSVDDGQRVFPSGLPPTIKSHLSRQVLLPALPCRPGETVLPRPVGRWRFFCMGAGGGVSLLGKALFPLDLRCIWPQGFADWQAVAGLGKQIRPQSFVFLNGFAAGCGTLPSARRVGPRVAGSEMAELFSWAGVQRISSSGRRPPIRNGGTFLAYFFR